MKKDYAADVARELDVLLGQRNSLAVSALLKTLDAAVEQYKAELLNAKPERVQQIQSYAKQLQALRDCITDPGMARIVLPS